MTSTIKLSRSINAEEKKQKHNKRYRNSMEKSQATPSRMKSTSKIPVPPLSNLVYLMIIYMT